MTAKQGVYASCKAKVQTIQKAYDALATAVEDYRTHLAALIGECDARDEQEKHLLVVAKLQHNTANGLLNTLDTDLHDDLVRLSDRVIRLKHWEDGTFV